MPASDVAMQKQARKAPTQKLSPFGYQRKCLSSTVVTKIAGLVGSRTQELREEKIDWLKVTAIAVLTQCDEMPVPLSGVDANASERCMVGASEARSLVSVPEIKHVVVSLMVK